MARQEADREDLWAEAVALTSRAELLIAGRAEPVLVGSRANGWWSVYFGQDVMLQFTVAGALRRAYRQGDLFRTQGLTLARLQRQRTADETVLLRHDLDPIELVEFRLWAHAELTQLHAAILANTITVQRFTVEDGVVNGDRQRQSFLEETAHTIQTILAAIDFLAPAIRGRA